MRKITALSLGLVLVAGTAFASNTGFKLNYTLKKPGSVSGNNWVSLPYFYFPDGNVNNTAQKLTDVCNDVNEFVKPVTKVSQIFFFDTANDKPGFQNCAAAFGTKVLVTGEGYSMVPLSDGITVNIVGAHNDSYAKNKVVSPATPTYLVLKKPGSVSGNNWVSVPYHSIADTLVQLCNDINDGSKPPANVSQVFYFDTANDKPGFQNCAATFGTKSVVAGEGYSFVPTADGKLVSIAVY